MPNNWNQLYKELTDFIAKHPEIEIGESVISLPGNVRPEFYNFFNAIRSTIMEEKTPALLKAARVLNDSYTQVEEEVIKLLGLDEVSMNPSLNRFLHDPIDELKRGLFAPLFDLLRARLDNKSFEQKAIQIIGTAFIHLYRTGYEKWIVISLVKLLEADKLFQVTPLKFSSSEEQTRMGDGLTESPVPPLKESKHLKFKDAEDVILTVPDLIVHSTKLNGYISFRSQYGRALAKAVDASQKRKWYSLDSIAPMSPDLTLVYVGDNPEELSLVADVNRICRPDIIIETRELKNWYQKEGLEKVKPYHYSLKPTLGTFIVSREPVAEKDMEGLEEGINILTVGFDASKLKPIIDTMVSCNQETEGKAV